jgi:helicase
MSAAHHHAGLGPDERGAVEGAFRRGELDALVATATLEMGLNLPVRQVVLYDLQAFDGTEFRPLSCCNVWQRAGRAGRPGLDTEGEVVLLAAAWDRQAGCYAEGEFEPVRSGFADRRALAEQVLAEVCAGLARTPAQLERVFAASLAARQGRLPEVAAVVREMCDAGMLARVQEDDEGCLSPRMKATRMGHIAVRHFLAPATVLLFRRVLERPDEWTFFDLLLTAACSADCEPTLPADYEELGALAGQLGREPSALLQRSRAELAGLLETDGKRLLAALKTALAARAWTRTGDADRVAEALSCYPFEVRRLCESMERLLTAMLASLEPEAEEAADAPRDDVLVRERLRALHRMVAGGLDEEAVTLTLVAGVGPKMARRLRSAGVEDVEALAQANPEDLRGVRGLSEKRAARWIDEATRIVRDHSAYRYRETGPTVALGGAGWPQGVEPYRLRRALELQVRTARGGYRVSGGLEPHRVRLLRGVPECDCPDAAGGNTCKHVLAVRLKREDRELRRLVERLQTAGAAEGLDLFDLWFRPGSPDRGTPA